MLPFFRLFQKAKNQDKHPENNSDMQAGYGQHVHGPCGRKHSFGFRIKPSFIAQRKCRKNSRFIFAQNFAAGK